MDRVQKLEYEKTMEDYFHEHKVYDLIQRINNKQTRKPYRLFN